MEIGPLFQLPEQRGGREALVHHHVGEAGRVEIESGVRAGRGDHVHALQRDRGGVPVARIFLQPHAVKRPPLPQHESAVAGEVRGLARPVGMFLHRGAMHREQRGKGAEIEEERRRIFERDLDRVGIGRTHPDGGEVRGLALAESLRAANVIELVGILRGRGREQRAPPRVEEILRRHRVAIAPARVFAQMKSVAQTVGRNLPALSHARLRHALAVVAREPFKERVADAARGLRGDQRRVEKLGLRAIDQHQLGALRRASAAREQGGGEDDEGGTKGGAIHSESGPCTKRAAGPRASRGARLSGFLLAPSLHIPDVCRNPPHPSRPASSRSRKLPSAAASACSSRANSADRRRKPRRPR